MKKLLSPFRILALLFISSGLVAQTTSRWELNRMDSLAGKKTVLLGAPKLVETTFGKAIFFNGTTDGIVVDANPVANASEFTLEVIFKPESSTSVEPRFVHIEQDNNNRITVELRLAGDFWYLDTYIKSGTSEKTLLSTGLLHPVGKWYHVALVYKNGAMTDYVNGKQELSGAVNFVPQTMGKTSVGVRQNLKYWYQGAVKTVKTTHSAIPSAQFIANEIDPLNAALGILTENEIAEPFLVFPNPATDQVQLSCKLANSEIVSWTMRNTLGHVVANGVSDQSYSGENIQLIERANLPAGLYFMHLDRKSKQVVLPVLFIDK